MAWHFPAKVDSSVETFVITQDDIIFSLDLLPREKWSMLDVIECEVVEGVSSLLQHRHITQQATHLTTFLLWSSDILCIYHLNSRIITAPTAQLCRIQEELRLRSKSGSVEGPKIGLSWKANAWGTVTRNGHLLLRFATYYDSLVFQNPRKIV